MYAKNTNMKRRIGMIGAMALVIAAAGILPAFRSTGGRTAHADDTATVEYTQVSAFVDKIGPTTPVKKNKWSITPSKAAFAYNRVEVIPIALVGTKGVSFDCLSIPELVVALPKLDEPGVPYGANFTAKCTGITALVGTVGDLYETKAKVINKTGLSATQQPPFLLGLKGDISSYPKAGTLILEGPETVTYDNNSTAPECVKVFPEPNEVCVITRGVKTAHPTGTAVHLASSSVGGVAELPEVAGTGTPLDVEQQSGTGYGLLAGLIVAAIAAGTVTFGGAAWYARRRFTRS